MFFLWDSNIRNGSYSLKRRTKLEAIFLPVLSQIDEYFNARKSYFAKNFRNKKKFMSLNIRSASPEDAELIVHFIKELAIYEKEPHKAVATQEDILRDGFGEKPYFECLIAEWENKPVGFALYFYNYSTWRGMPGIYLEDLFVSPEARGKGAGKGLLKKLAQLALEKNCSLVQWQVLDWNQPSIDFYESLGAFHLKEWFTYRIEKDALKKLAE